MNYSNLLIYIGVSLYLIISFSCGQISSDTPVPEDLQSDGISAVDSSTHYQCIVCERSFAIADEGFLHGYESDKENHAAYCSVDCFDEAE